MITWFRADVDLLKNLFYEKVLFFTQLSYHLMCKLLKKSYMLSNVLILFLGIKERYGYARKLCTLFCIINWHPCFRSMFCPDCYKQKCSSPNCLGTCPCQIPWFRHKLISTIPWNSFDSKVQQYFFVHHRYIKPVMIYTSALEQKWYLSRVGVFLYLKKSKLKSSNGRRFQTAQSNYLLSKPNLGSKEL